MIFDEEMMMPKELSSVSIHLSIFRSYLNKGAFTKYVGG